VIDGQTFLDFYVSSQKKIIELETLGLHIWNLCGVLWHGEKQELILNILTCLNTLEGISLELKKKLYDLVQKEKKMELFDKDRIIWEIALSDYHLKNQWLDLNLNLEQLKEKNEEDSELMYATAIEKIEAITKK
jgi:hypothetical protein